MLLKSITQANLKQLVTTVILSLAGFTLVTMRIKPNFIDRIAYEDGLVEWLSAIFAALAAVVMLLFATNLARHRRILQAVVSVLVALIFFIISMEEISWGQRVFNVESSDFFAAQNMQGEINLHNINTKMSETIYYLGAFVLLVLLPSIRGVVENLLRKLKLAFLNIFLPAGWLLIPFAITSGFTGHGRLVRVYVFVTFVATVVILSMRLAYQVRVKLDRITQALIVLSIIITSWALYQCNYFGYTGHGVRSWMMTEWNELFISAGLLAYSASLYFDNRLSSSDTKGKRVS